MSGHMINKKIGIIDYGTSNIFNLVNAFEYLNVNVKIIDEPQDMSEITHLVLPGVGAFENGMNSLKNKNLVDLILDHAEKDLPFLGICLGMQMMLSESYEFGNHSGLNVINGKIRKIPNINNDGVMHKIPHIGWNEINISSNNHLKKSIVNNAADNQAMYFVHSYMAHTDEKNILATCNYNNIIIPSIISSSNIFGCQFHPEKSGEKGLSILMNFINL